MNGSVAHHIILIGYIWRHSNSIQQCKKYRCAICLTSIIAVHEAVSYVHCIFWFLGLSAVCINTLMLHECNIFVFQFLSFLWCMRYKFCILKKQLPFPEEYKITVCYKFCILKNCRSRACNCQNTCRLQQREICLQDPVFSSFYCFLNLNL